MIIRKILLIALLFGSFSQPVRADDDIFANEGVTSFQQDENAWRRNDGQTVNVPKESKAKEVLPDILTSIGPVAWDNIANAEKIFCYEVAVRPEEYDGYSIDSMALTGFCGVIKDEVKNIVLSDLFMDSKNAVSYTHLRAHETSV